MHYMGTLKINLFIHLPTYLLIDSFTYPIHSYTEDSSWKVVEEYIVRLKMYQWCFTEPIWNKFMSYN